MRLPNIQYKLLKLVKIYLLGVLLVALVGCGGGGSGGTVVGSVQLPQDFRLTLWCTDVGLADEQCILDDPENAYARSIVNDNTKWLLDGDVPSAKARYYLWGTAQAKGPRGENQFYTALALHQLYTQGGSELAKLQAKRAYRAVLDNYFDSVTFFVFQTPEGQSVCPEHISSNSNNCVIIPQSLRELVGQNLYDPQSQNLLPLYDSELLVQEAFGQWGYFYDPDNGLITKNQ